MAYGFSPVSAGELRVFGLDVTRDLPAIKTRLGVCQQGNTLDPDLTVAENLLVYSRYYGMPRALARRRAAELLEFIALEGAARRPGGGALRRARAPADARARADQRPGAADPRRADHGARPAVAPRALGAARGAAAGAG